MCREEMVAGAEGGASLPFSAGGGDGDCYNVGLTWLLHE